MYINKYDKNNMQTSGNYDIIVVLQIRKKTLKAIIIKAITYFHSCPGFCDTQYIWHAIYNQKKRYHRFSISQVKRIVIH